MEVRDEYVADTRRYSGPLREAAKEADRFSDRNERAALAARKMGLAASEAAQKAARAQKDAADAAERLARGEIKADEAAQAEARALREVERASIKAAEAQRATARAADEAAQQQRQLARDAALAAAAQRLTALKAAGAAKEYNATLERLKVAHGDLSKTAVGGFKRMEEGFKAADQGIASGLSDLQGMWRALPGAIIVGLELLPAAAAAAGAGITLGLGGALSKLAIEAQAKTRDVQEAFSKLKAHAVSEFTQWTKPFHATLLSVAQDAQHAFDAAGPAIRAFSAQAAPAISRFAHNAALSMSQLNPAIDSLGKAFAAVLDDLGPRMPQIMGNFATSIKAITDAVAANPEAIGRLATGISDLARYAGDSIGFLIRYEHELESIFKIANLLVIGPIGPLGDSITQLGNLFVKSGNDLNGLTVQEFPSFQQQAAAAAVATQGLMTAQQAATLSTNDLKNALDRLTGANQNAFDSTTAYKQALMAATAQAKASNAGINGNSKAAIANRQALSNLSQAIKGVMENAHPTSSAIEQMRQRFINAAVGMGVSRKEAVALANKLLGVRDAANKIPSHKGISLSDNTASVRGHIAALQRSITNLHGKTVTIDYIEVVHRTLQAERARADGGYVGYADGGSVRRQYPSGGPVSGPGTSRSDSIPAMLSNGEYVINAEQTRKYRPLLDAINYKLDGFAKGGQPLTGGYKVAKPKPWLQRGYQDAAYVAARQRVEKAKARPEYAAAMAAQRQLQAMRHTIYGGWFNGQLPAPGSAHGTVVQHVNPITVNVVVQGSIRSDREIADMIQTQILRGRKGIVLPVGR